MIHFPRGIITEPEAEVQCEKEKDKRNILQIGKAEIVVHDPMMLVLRSVFLINNET